MPFMRFARVFDEAVHDDHGSTGDAGHDHHEQLRQVLPVQILHMLTPSQIATWLHPFDSGYTL